jgi:acyl dehydratase
LGVSGDARARVPVGHRFPGGTRVVERWENWLLTDCTRRRPMDDGLLHPVVLFHVPIQAAGTSIAELFELCSGDGTPGSVTLLGYDWEYLRPLREGVEYRAEGGIEAADAGFDDDGRLLHDDVTFRIELTGPDGHVAARVTNRWRFRRSGTAPHAAAPAAPRGVGEPVPPLVIDDVGADRMKTMAALLRDPYAIHWDPEAVRAAGHGDRPVNQGPLNLAYVANMLMAWAGDGSIRRLTVSFHARVLADDTVVATGEVIERAVVDGEQVARCAVRLTRGDDVIVSGTAVVFVG